MSFNNSSQHDASSFQREMMKPGARERFHNCRMEVVHRPDEPATASEPHSEEVQPHEGQEFYQGSSDRKTGNIAIKLAFEH